MLSKWVAEPPMPPLRAKTLTPEKASDFLHSGRYAPDVQKDARGVRAFGLLCGNKGARKQTNAQHFKSREPSFGSSLSRKACGELERQSLSVKAPKRRGNRVLLAHKTDALIKRGNNKTMSVDKSYVHALSLRVNTLPRVYQRGQRSVSERSSLTLL